jgi:hypothetical protein
LYKKNIMAKQPKPKPATGFPTTPENMSVTRMSIDRPKYDSLMGSSLKKKMGASKQEMLGMKQMIEGVPAGQKTGPNGKALPSGRERIAIANKLKAEASKDSTEAMKYLKLRRR